MTREELIQHLQYHFANVQKSERWVMYRLVNPIVDYACEQTKWLPFFEYVQASQVRTVQSVDIALLEDNKPRIYIEVKKIDKELSPDLVNKYLPDNLIGAVTNGCDWIFASQQKYLYLSLLHESGFRINEHDLDVIIDILRHPDHHHLVKIDAELEIETRVMKKKFSKPKSIQLQKAEKKDYPKSQFDSAQSALNAVNTRTDIPDLTRMFLLSFLSKANKHRRGIYFEMNENRFVWFDVNLHTQSNRLGRVLLKGGIPDILIFTQLVSKNPRLEQIVRSEIHKKTADMRLFRFVDPQVAKNFGEELGRIIGGQ